MEDAQGTQIMETEPTAAAEPVEPAETAALAETDGQPEPDAGGRPKSDNPAAEFVEKTLRKRRLEAELKQLETQLARLEPDVVDQLNDLGLQNMKTADGPTVHLRMELRAYLNTGADGEKTEAMEALRAHDMGYLVKEGVNLQSLTSRIREFRKNNEEIPEGLQGHVLLIERPRASVRVS